MKTPSMGGVWLLDEAAGLLRAMPARVWTVWLAATLPFVWGVLDFIEQMGRSAFAAELLVPKTLGLVLLFWLKNMGQAYFVRECEGLLRGERPRAAPQDWARAALVQAAVQPWRFVLLPLASLVVVPLPWLAGFFRYVGAAALERKDGILRAAWNAGRGNARAQTVGMTVLVILWMLLFVNLGALWFILPFLGKAFLGWESDFIRLAERLMNVITLLVTGVLAAFALEPLQNAMAAVRAFYLRAETDGEDLMSLLRRVAAALLLAAVLLPGSAQAQSSDAAKNLDSAQLEQRIESVLRQPEFAWRMPKQEGASKGWVESLFRGVEQAINYLRDLYLAIFGGDEQDRAERDKGWGLSSQQLQWLMGLAGVMVTILAGMMLWKARRSVRVAVSEAGAASTLTPDLNDESLSPEMRAEQEWLRAAEEMFARGQHRLAIRALHLAGLRHLGERGWVTLQPAKTGQEYARELNRKLRDAPDATANYARGLRAYEEVWYGFADPSAEVFERVRTDWNTLRTTGGAHG